VEADKARMAANSFETVALEWHAMKSKKWAKVTADKALVHLRTYVFPEIGHLPLASIKASALHGLPGPTVRAWVQSLSALNPQ
jgi:hypothetical protein